MTDEGGYIYFIANMYSCHRYKDSDPLDKLDDLWSTLSTIELNENETEFKVAFWHETANEVYDLMKEIWTPESQTSVHSSLSNSNHSPQVEMRIDENLCLGCGSCKSVCPTDSILSGTVYRINSDTCIECGSCASVCPIDAIS